MNNNSEIILAIGVMATIVYLTRISGYLIGLQMRHITWIKPILEALPGCAMIAILIPAIRQGSEVDFAALICVLVIMWKTDSVVIATVTDMTVLIFGDLIISNLSSI